MKKKVNFLPILQRLTRPVWSRVETTYAIVVKNGKPQWKNQPPQPSALATEHERYLYNIDWPVITKPVFDKLVKKGLITELNGVWTANDTGRTRIWSRYRRPYGRPKPTLTKHRRIQQAKARRAALIADRNKPDPVPAPPRQEKKRGKLRHEGYRRQCQKVKDQMILAEQL